jgi:acetyl-CoA carboxylase carboxyl transferase subunit beta
MEIAWFKKIRKPKRAVEHKRIQVPEGLWVKCNSCKEIIYKKEVLKNANVCPKCTYHFRISARERLSSLFDDGHYQEIDTDIYSLDPLKFKDVKAYKDRLRTYRERTGLNEAVINARGTLGGMPVMISAMEYGFMGGSMGSAVGEKVTRAVERALDDRAPLIVISCSGGARMQEGVLSLMQMAKISAALAKLHEARIPYISIMTDPTTGGVTASYAMLGDLNIAEPKALIGFAGPRVIEQTIREKLPDGFQRSEFLQEHGMIDFIVPRREMRDVLIRCMKFLFNADMLADTAPSSNSGSTAGRASGSKPGKSALETKAEKRPPLSFPNPVAARSRTFPSENL